MHVRRRPERRSALLESLEDERDETISDSEVREVSLQPLADFKSIGKKQGLNDSFEVDNSERRRNLNALEKELNELEPFHYDKNREKYRPGSFFALEESYLNPDIGVTLRSGRCVGNEIEEHSIPQSNQNVRKSLFPIVTGIQDSRDKEETQTKASENQESASDNESLQTPSFAEPASHDLPQFLPNSDSLTVQASLQVETESEMQIDDVLPGAKRLSKAQAALKKLQPWAWDR